MLFFCHFEGKEYQVRVEARRGKTFVSFEDEPEQVVDLSYYGHFCTFINDSRVFHASVVGKKEEYTVWRPQGNLSFQLESEYRRIVSKLRGQDEENENAVFAKMPGKIVKIMVSPGDSVDSEKALIVMEAMKMENEIRASGHGVISKILVKEGQAVESGELLIELEPPKDE